MTALPWLLLFTGSTLMLLTILGVLVIAHRESEAKLAARRASRRCLYCAWANPCTPPEGGTR